MAALERLSCDGHGGDEAGRERHPQLLPDGPSQAQPRHPGHTPFHSLQDLPRGQSHHPRNPGEIHVIEGRCMVVSPRFIGMTHWFERAVFESSITDSNAENTQAQSNNNAVIFLSPWLSSLF